MKLLVALGCVALGLYFCYMLLDLNWDGLQAMWRGL